MKQSIFQDRQLIREFQDNISFLLNNSVRFQNLKNIPSPRTVGDETQEIIEEFFEKEFSERFGEPIDSKFSRRAMADVAFNDKFGNYIMVDVKTHNTETVFNMPNLSSVQRIAKFYEDDDNFFTLLLLKYSIEGKSPNFTGVELVPIEHLSWDCLTIGALGWGQIQIANSNNIVITRDVSRKDWMLSLCDRLEIFYPKEIAKIQDRVGYFQKVRDFWNNK